MSDLTSHLLVAMDHETPVEPWPDLARLCAYTRRSPTRETTNEDAAGLWSIRGVGLVLAVADGMGGMAQGARASARAVEALDASLRDVDQVEALRPAILDGFEAAGREVRALGGAGTTLVVAEIAEDHVRTYHVGDSAAMVVGQRGRVKLRTVAHSPVGYGVAAGLIAPEEALEHRDRHYITNYVGAAEMSIEVGSRARLARHDTLVLASDGLLDNLSPEEISDVVRTGPLAKAGRTLAERAAERMRSTGNGTPDDLTFILMRRGAA